ncbi:MAG: CCA tRNA nucleotidyltransferase, partial [Candidatus Doudnabacteria bacterium]|nr:CCA tRNA nucleotidyltransferase [Candidatus Doudnabacteria bacterium]
MSPLKSNKLYKAGEKVVRLLNKKGNTAFFVGGVVRNDLMNRESNNIDIATDAIPEEVEKILNAENIKVKPIGKKFGSILAIVDSFPIEITTFRAEGRYTDNRHPDNVEFIKDYSVDAKRRDFTVNALYLDPQKKEILDPTEKGMKDLKAKLLRFVGDPRKRIDEDGLRMLRGVRLATQLGFKLEKNSFAAIKTRAKYIQDISVERVRAELDKILSSENRVEGIKLLDKTGLLKFIVPEFEKLKSVSHLSKYFHLEGDVFTHTLRAVELLKTDNLDVIYAVLFHDIGKVIKPEKIFKANEWRFSFKGHIRLSGE